MNPALLIVPLALAGFVTIWCGTVWLISRFGWSTLAAHHRHDGPLPPNRVGWQFGMINSARYKGSLGIAWDSQALYLDTPLIFRPGHVPLRIAFSSIISRSRLQQGRFGATEALVVRAGEKTIRLMLTSNAVAPFAAQLPALPPTTVS